MPKEKDFDFFLKKSIKLNVLQHIKYLSLEHWRFSTHVSLKADHPYWTISHQEMKLFILIIQN